jgi:hypothetical protein
MQDYIVRPFFQMAAFTLLSMAMVSIARPKYAESVLNIAGAAYGVFILVNSGLVFFVHQVWSYFFYSMLFSVVYLLVTALTIPTYIKLTKANGSSENAMVFLIAMYHPFALLLAIFLHWFFLGRGTS